MGIVSKLKQIPRIFYVVLAIFLATWSLSVPILMTQEANAAPVCVNDTAGANDETNQKDLTKLCVDYAGAPTSVATIWNWDETGTSGANTMDACNLFDSDGDGNINYAVCVTTKNDPAVMQSYTTYSCGDDKINGCTSPVTLIANGSTVCSVSQVTNDPFANGTSSPKDTQASCTVYLANVGGANSKLIDVCSYPSQSPQSDPSDCIIARPSTGKLEVRKVLSPANDTGKFNLQIDGVTKAANVGNGGTTDEIVVSAANHSVAELAGTGTTLTNYTTTIVCKNLNGTGTIVAQGTTTSLASVPVTDGSDIVCTITNSVVPSTLTLVKTVTNNNGGNKTPSDFQGKIDGNNVAWSTPITLSAGTHTASETGLSTYTASSWTGDCAANGTITLSPGQNATCYITNDDIAPSLTLNKILIKDNGGTASESDWTLTATGTGQSPTNLSGATGTAGATSGANFKADTYTLGETGGPLGYTASLWTCSGGVVVTNGQISLGLGQTTVCSITNDDDAPKLTLIKALGATYGSGNVIGDWNLTATGTAQSPTNLSGATGTAGATSGADFKADTYTLGETGPSGYTSSWDCVGGNSVVNATIAISLGQNVTCTVTNSGIQPKITLYKVIDGDQYGDNASENDFGLTIGGEAATSGTTYGKNVGSYSIDEEGLYGYEFVEITGDEECPTKLGDTVTLELGDDITCTIHNRAIQPKLIVKKHVINGNNGTSTAGSFTMTVSGTNVSDNEFPGDENGTEIYLDEGEYSVDELENSAYAKSIGADCSGSIAVGEVKTCTITNDDIQPKITLVKVIENDEQYGDDAVANDFGLTIDGNTVDSGVAYGKDAGYYQISENGLEGYQFVNISGHERCPETLGGSVQLFVGDDITCTIQNRAIQPKLMIKKTVVNDNSGTKEASDFTITVDGTNVSDDEFPGTSVYTTIYLDEGTYSVDEIADEGYIKTLSKDCSGTIALGETKYCTVTNDDITNPAIEVIKYGPETAYEGDVVTYWFWVTNTGDTTLYNVNVSDDIADNEVCVTTTLAKGQSTWCSATYTIPSQQKADVTNTVTACGYEYAEDSEQTPVCNDDSHTLDVLHPSIAVVKSGPSTASAGEKVTYTFTVTNTGDIALSSLTVEDDIAGSGTYVSGDINDDLILEPGETWVYTANYNIPSDQTKNVVNTVTVCGYEWFKQDGAEYTLSRQTLDSSDAINNPEETPVCATDSHTLTVPQVLGATTTAAPKPTVLANTGSGINVAQLIAPVFLLGATLGLAIASRRTNKTSTK